MSRSKQTMELPPVDLLYIAERTTEYLLKEGFQSVQYKGGNYYYKKPENFGDPPQYLRFAFKTGEMEIEGFIKCTLFPGIYAGEMGIEGSFYEIRKTLLVRSINNLKHHTQKTIKQFLEENPGNHSYPDVQCTLY